jgi:hypothetical protein
MIHPVNELKRPSFSIRNEKPCFGPIRNYYPFPIHAFDAQRTVRFRQELCPILFENGKKGQGLR